MKKRLISSFCFLIPLFYVSMGHMVGAPLPSILLGHENMMIFALTQLLLATPVLIINKKFFIVGFQALWNRAPNMDSLVAPASPHPISTASLRFTPWRIIWGMATL